MGKKLESYYYSWIKIAKICMRGAFMVFIPRNDFVWSVHCWINQINVKYYNEVIMGAMASQITSLTIVYSTAYSGADQRKHERHLLGIWLHIYGKKLFHVNKKRLQICISSYVCYKFNINACIVAQPLSIPIFPNTMITSSNGNIFCVTGHLCGESTSHRWIHRTKASDAELWCFLWSAPE